ncbi:MAG: M28 family peptidase, partial [Oscillospiraceae bacterium]|nr:M28 family peptidase [Oscillospiraceae bacterium]
MADYGKKAYDFLEKLSFPRTSGSDMEHKAANMIADEIKSYGLTPTLEPFEVRWTTPVHALLKVTSPVEETFTVTGLINSADTPKGGCDAEFYYMRLIDDITLKEARGKFILINGRPSEENYKKLMEAKIAGMLWMNGTSRDTYENSDLDTMRSRACYAKHGKIPGFAIRMIDAMKLLRLAPKTVHFELESTEFVSTSYNVVTTVPGTDLAEETIAVGGHYDSVEFSYGSWDNGAGTVQVLGLLEHLSKNPPRRTVKAILFGSEEIGLEGSKAYMKAHPEEGESLKCMVNLDVGGNLLGWESLMVTATTGAEEYLKGILKEGGFSIEVKPGVMSSDGTVFADYTVPAINFASIPKYQPTRPLYLGDAVIIIEK